MCKFVEVNNSIAREFYFDKSLDLRFCSRACSALQKLLARLAVAACLSLVSFHSGPLPSEWLSKSDGWLGSAPAVGQFCIGPLPQWIIVKEQPLVSHSANRQRSCGPEVESEVRGGSRLSPGALLAHLALGQRTNLGGQETRKQALAKAAHWLGPLGGVNLFCYYPASVTWRPQPSAWHTLCWPRLRHSNFHEEPGLRVSWVLGALPPWWQQSSVWGPDSGKLPAETCFLSQDLQALRPGRVNMWVLEGRVTLALRRPLLSSQGLDLALSCQNRE